MFSAAGKHDENQKKSFKRQKCYMTLVKALQSYNCHWLKGANWQVFDQKLSDGRPSILLSKNFGEAISLVLRI
jgi:hypothetical protein